MFGRSQSGPSGLSINTTSANSLSGQSSLPPPSASKPAPSFFSNASTSQSQQNAATSQPQSTSNIFGNLSQPQQTGGLFSSLNPTGGNQQQQQGSGGGLFASSNTQQTQPQQGGGLFSSLGQTQNQSQQPQSSLFGGLSTQNKMSSTFGNAQAPAQTQQMPNLPAATSLFSSQIGQYQKQQTVPGVVLSVNELRPTTRFNDLHEDLQKGIEYVDNFILSQIRKQEDCSAANEQLDDMSSQMPPDIEYCVNTLETLQQALENDAESIAFAKNLVKADFDDSKLSFKVIQNLSLPQQFHHNALRSSAAPPRLRGLSFPNESATEGLTSIVDYFMREADNISKSLENYNRNITEVESFLKGVESNTMQQMQQMMLTRVRDGGQKSAEDQVRELAVVLREFGNGIMAVATKVGETREKVQEVMLGP